MRTLALAVALAAAFSTAACAYDHHRHVVHGLRHVHRPDPYPLNACDDATKRLIPNPLCSGAGGGS